MHRLAACLALLLIASCRPPVYTPKPAGYFRVDTPATHAYRLFDKPGFPYTFEYPVYGTITYDTVIHKDEAPHPYWINIVFPGMDGEINITYKEISGGDTLSKLVEDSWRLSFMHHEKADYINDTAFVNAYGAASLLYRVGGNSASRYQFVCSDSTKHFMRGALYFDVTPNADSLKPVTDFLEKDIWHLLATVRWR